MKTFKNGPGTLPGAFYLANCGSWVKVEPMSDLFSKRKRALLLAMMGCLVFVSTPQASAENLFPNETPVQHAQRMGWWRQSRFGLFITWGLYSIPAGKWNGKDIGNGRGSEWIMNFLSIPVADYAALAPQFNPVKFNADDWAGLAKDAGVKYVVITAKHHEGFAMYDSKVDSFNIVQATPFKRDVLRELTDACKKQDIRLGFYYSQSQDWHHPGGRCWPVNGRPLDHGEWDPAQEGSMDDYIDKLSAPQVRELLTQYGPGTPAVFWWDTPLEMTPGRAEKFVAPIRELRHDLITNSRLGGGIGGDTSNAEQKIPPHGFPNRDWETCMTMNGSWGYKAEDQDWKSTRTLLYDLVDIVSKDGNFLLNVGPMADGSIPQPSIDRLREIGAWLKVNGDSIFGTEGTPFGAELGADSVTEKEKDGKPHFVPEWKLRYTTKPGLLYIHFLEWPKYVFELQGLVSRINKAYLLSDPARKSLNVTQAGSDAKISLPAAAPDPLDSVVVLQFADRVVKTSVKPIITGAVHNDTGAPVAP